MDARNSWTEFSIRISNLVCFQTTFRPFSINGAIGLASFFRTTQHVEKYVIYNLRRKVRVHSHRQTRACDQKMNFALVCARVCNYCSASFVKTISAARLQCKVILIACKFSNDKA